MGPLLANLAMTPEAISAGEEVFNTQCFTCHLIDLSGQIGPSFLDDEWIHGGTAEDIVMHPADDYVADFVAGISRLKVVKAHAVMQSGEAFEQANGRLPADVRRVSEGEALSTLINLAIDDDAPIVITDGGRDVGVVTRRDILRTVIEGAEVS